MDQMPRKKFWNRKFVQQSKVGRKNKEYLRKGPGYICQVCPYASNKVCGKCIFARWNVDGVLAGFSPARAYREAHKDDISASPLMMQFDDDPRLVIPPRDPRLLPKLAHVKKVIG